MGQWYWISEYLKLLAAYGFVLYVWPQVVFENHLKGRSLCYRYGFSVIVTVMIVNTAVILLGLIHCLRPWVTSLLFFAVFFWRLIVNHHPLRELARDVQSRHHETISRRRMVLRSLGRIKRGFLAWFRPVCSRIRGHWLEYSLLMIALIFGTIYFSWGAFDEHSYGFGDQYVHHQWIYGLVQGKAFYDGIYPEAMHCMIYLTCTLFRIRLYSGVLFFAGIHVHVLLISAWLLMKAVFRWQYTPLAALAMFLCFDQLCIDEVFSMSRLSWTLPMEYALYSAFLSGLFLLRFLRRVRRGERVKLCPLKPAKWGILHDEDLFLFGGAVAVSLAVHFYVTIVAFVFCAVTALVYIREVFRRGSFLPLAATVMLSLFVAVAPMAAAFAVGYPLQGSLYWAMSVVEEGEDKGSGVSEQEVSESAEELIEEYEAENGDADGELMVFGPDGQPIDIESGKPAVPEKTRKALPVLLKEKIEYVYWGAYNTLYPGHHALAVLIATCFGLFASLTALILTALWGRLKERSAAEREELLSIRDAFDGALIITLLSIAFMVMYNATGLGLPQLVAGSRLCSTEQMLLMMVYAIPLDCLVVLLARFLGKRLIQVMAVIIFFGVYAAAQAGGFFHSYLYFELTRYNAAVETTNHIIDTLPPQMYTIISTTDELYQVIESGFHEELLNFIQNEDDGTYTIPTPYLLLYIEKKPIWYAQSHFARGPRWLAREEYPKLYNDAASQCPDILCTEISTKAASEKIFHGAKLSDSASDLEGRRILESKAYEWYQDFSSMHPASCRIIYEDEDFMCCCITQNPGSLYTLGIRGEKGR